MRQQTQAKAATGVLTLVLGAITFGLIAVFYVGRWLFRVIRALLSDDVVAREGARRQLAVAGVCGVGLASSIAFASITTRTEWHARHAQFAGLSLIAALAIAGASAIFAWAHLAGAGRPLRAARSVAFALAYGAFVTVALVARYDSPTIAFARAALANGDVEAAELTAQTIIATRPRSANAARALLDDVRERRLRDPNTGAVASSQLLLQPWFDSARREAALRDWRTRLEDERGQAYRQRDFGRLGQVAAALQPFDAQRSADIHSLSRVVQRAQSATGEPCETALPTQGPLAELRSEYISRLQTATTSAIQIANGASSNPDAWRTAGRTARCLEALGERPSMSAAALEAKAQEATRAQAASIPTAYGTSYRPTDSDQSSGGSYGGGGYGGSTYVHGYYRRGRYVRGYYRRRR